MEALNGRVSSAPQETFGAYVSKDAATTIPLTVTVNFPQSGPACTHKKEHHTARRVHLAQVAKSLTDTLALCTSIRDEKLAFTTEGLLSVAMEPAALE